jgi:MoaD family protein
LIKVYLTGHLKDYTGNRREFKISNVPTVTELIGMLNEMFPGIRDRIFDDHDETRPFVNIFVNGYNIRDGEKERTKLKDGDNVHILPSVAGGSNA